MDSPEATWPHAVTLVLAAESSRQRRWAVSTAIEIVRKLAGERKVVLADVRGQTPSSIAEALGVGEGEGIVDVLFRGASFSAVARRPESENFFFLSAGSAPPPLQVFYHHPRWQKIASRLAAADAHLLPCVSAEDWLEAGPIPGFAACILLNGSGREIELPGGARKLAEFLAPVEIREETVTVDARPDDAVEPESESAVQATAEPADTTPQDKQPEVEPPFEAEPAFEIETPALAAEEPEASSPSGVGWSSDEEAAHHRSGGRSGPMSGLLSGPRRRSIVPAVALVAAIALVVILWKVMGSGQTPEGGETLAVTDTTEAAGPAALTGGPDLAGGRPRGVNLPYSVAIASYSSLDDALARQRELARADLPVYVAPTPVRGVVYYRVFAGMLPEREQGEALMADLVRRGIKDTVRAWDVRPARYAFSFGIYPTARDARSVVETLQEQGVPAYTVPAPAVAGSDEVGYHVYAGGYEEPEDAQPLRTIIDRAGLETELVERVGWVPQ